MVIRSINITKSLLYSQTKTTSWGYKNSRCLSSTNLALHCSTHCISSGGKKRSELFQELYSVPHGTMQCSILLMSQYFIFLCLWSEGNCNIADTAICLIPRTSLFLRNVFWHVHRPYHLSVKAVDPYQKGHNWGKAVCIFSEQIQCWSAFIRSFLLPSNICFFVFYSCGTMTSRKKVLLKVIILGDSGWVRLNGSLFELWFDSEMLTLILQARDLFLCFTNQFIRLTFSVSLVSAQHMFWMLSCDFFFFFSLL